MIDKKRITPQFEGEEKDTVKILMGDSKPDKPSKPGSKPNKTDSLLSKPSKPGHKRQTYIIKEEYIEGIKRVAYWERREITSVINEALEWYLKEHKLEESK